MPKLSEYRRKRDFAKTPEPPPDAAGRSSSLNPGDRSPYFIQRHDASHLHYDFRLQIGGVLKSWAVPKGPSLDPADKRLAVEVEDHPVDYGTFEGNIPKGQYGGGSVMLWDHGEFELLDTGTADEQLTRGDLKFRLHGRKLKGEFALVRTRIKAAKPQWLLIKKKDQYAQGGWDIDTQAVSISTGRTQNEIASNAKAARTTPLKVKPMLATLTDKVPSGKGWAFEVKWDGFRAIASIENGKAAFVSRNGLSFTELFPEIGTLASQVTARDAILDGEIVAIDAEGKPSFQALQPRLGLASRKTAADTSIVLYLFDILALDGKDLRDKPFSERKKALEKIVKPAHAIQLSKHIVDRGQALLKAAEEQGLEGIVAKRLDSTYQAGRSRDWLKIKIQGRDEFAICGWTEGKRKISSLVLGRQDAGKWIWAGNAGTGFDNAELDRLLALLKKLETKANPFADKSDSPRNAHWVKPELMAEIKYAQKTAGGKLRAPVYLGLRPDKRASNTSSTSRPASTPAAAELPSFVSNPEKIYFPKDNIRKRDLIVYYDSIADAILPHLKDRPLSLRRYPNGIAAGSFFQKNLDSKIPDWLKTITLYSEDSKRDIRFALADNRESLLFLVNMGCIDHNPWMSRVSNLDSPDYALIDLDPHECPFSKVIESAQAVHAILDSMKISTLVKTSGGRGIHIVIPLKSGHHNYDEVRGFTESIARRANEEYPKLFTLERSLAKRQKGRVYFDFVQIGRGKTIASPYSVRPRPGAPVSMPLEWDEVNAKLKPENFNIGNALARCQSTGDLFAPLLSSKQTLKKR